MIIDHKKYDLFGKAIIQNIRIKAPFTFDFPITDNACFLYMLQGEMQYHRNEDRVNIPHKHALFLNCIQASKTISNLNEGGVNEMMVVNFHPDILKRIYPGQTVIVPPAVTMEIDFPEATNLNPTQCIALAIDQEQIQKTIAYLNEFFPKEGSNEKWLLNYDEYHFYNNEEIAYLINKVIRICSERTKEKDVLADLTLKELLVRIMQTQNLKTISDDG